MSTHHPDSLPNSGHQSPHIAAEHAVHGLLLSRAAVANGAVDQAIKDMCARIDLQVAAQAQSRRHAQDNAGELDLQWQLMAQAVADGEADAATLATWRNKREISPHAADFERTMVQYKRLTTASAHTAQGQSAMLETVLMSLQAPRAHTSSTWSVPAWSVLACAVLLSLVAMGALSLSGSLSGLHILLLFAHTIILSMILVAFAWASLRSLCIDTRHIYGRLLSWRLRPVPCVTMFALAIIMPTGLLVMGL